MPMHRFTIAFALVCLLPFLGHAQAPKADQQVLQAEKDRFAAMVKGDKAALERLLADDLTYTHSSALFESKGRVHSRVSRAARSTMSRLFPARLTGKFV